MDCHRCQHLRYFGGACSRCTHRGHKDVVFSRYEAKRKPYNRQICPDFKLKKRCANCTHWNRGEYFADGRTPAKKGKCMFGIVERNGEDCPMWEQNKKTSWKKRKQGEKA